MENRVQNFLEKCKDVESGWIIASLTDRYVVDKWPASSETQDCFNGDQAYKVLEIRVFNEKCEHRLFRPDIGSEFHEREITDPSESGQEYYDEVQYLDIDEKKGVSEKGEVTATGGGKYHLPLDKIKDAKIKIRYYLSQYEDSGQAYVKDWRLVELMEGK